jgi:hypothetical protein
MRVIRTSITLSTPQIESAVKKIATLNFRKNTSGYIESLIIEDLVNRGYDRSKLLDEQLTEEKAH